MHTTPSPGSEGSDGPPQLRSGRPASATDRLANERTYLAWVRTGLAAFGLCIAVGAVLPALTKGDSWPFVLVGAAFGLLGVGLLAYGHLRRVAVDGALDRGQDVPQDGSSSGITLAAILMGLVMVVLVVVLGLR